MAQPVLQKFYLKTHNYNVMKLVSSKIRKYFATFNM